MSFNFTDLLLEAGDLVRNAETDKDICKILIEYINSAIKPDLSCFYMKDKSDSQMKLDIKKGFLTAPDVITKESELLTFLSESKEVVCLNTRKIGPFEDLLLNDSMNSGMAISIFFKEIEYGTLIVNSMKAFYFKQKELFFIENLVSLVKNKDLIRS
jgi:hypothetical protein